MCVVASPVARNVRVDASGTCARVTTRAPSAPPTRRRCVVKCRLSFPLCVRFKRRALFFFFLAVDGQVAQMYRDQGIGFGAGGAGGGDGDDDDDDLL